MDPAHSKMVQEAFIRMYDRGLIYRDQMPVNWSCTLQTAISDMEVGQRRVSLCHRSGGTHRGQWSDIASHS